MPATVLGTHGSGDHASRPAGNAVPDGSLYSCTTHSLIYLSNYAGNSWSTWANLAGTGSMATDSLWDAAGDLAVGSGANTAAKLALGATNGMALRRVSGAVAWDLPPGYEFDYVANTAGANITATSEATADTFITGSAVTYDGSTPVIIEFFAPQARPRNTTAAGNLMIYLYDGSSSIGRMGFFQNVATGSDIHPVFCSRRLTPSAAAHTYSIRAAVDAGTGNIGAGAGGSTAVMPAYMRIIKV